MVWSRGRCSSGCWTACARRNSKAPSRRRGRRWSLWSGCWQRTAIRGGRAREARRGMLVLKGQSHWVMALAYSPHGPPRAPWSWRRDLRLGDLAGGAQRLCLGQELSSEVFALAFAPDGKTLASDGRVNLSLRDPRAPSSSERPHEPGVRLWDPTDGRLLTTWSRPQGTTW